MPVLVWSGTYSGEILGFFSKLDNSRITTAYIAIMLLASMGLFIDGFDLNEISTVNELILKNLFAETQLEYLLINVSSFIGMGIGAVALGLVSDRYGRNLVFALDLVFFAVFGILAGLATNWYELFAFRFLLGIGIGGDYPVSSTILSEFSPRMKRGKVLMLMVGFYWIGILVSNGISYALISSLGLLYWRYLFVISGLVAVPIILLRFRIPESPRWLKAHGRPEEAMESIERIAGAQGTGSESTETGARPVRRISLFFSIFFVLSAWFLFDLASYPVGFYFPNAVFVLLGFSGRYSLVVALLKISVFGALISVGAIIGYIIAILIIDRIGRRPLTIAGFLAMTVLLLVFTVFRLTGTPVVIFYFLFVMMEQWIGAVTLFYPTEIFRTDIRSTMQGIATMVSRIGAIAGIFLFPLFQTYQAFFVAFLACLAGLLISVALAPETVGRTIEAASGEKVSENTG